VNKGVDHPRACRARSDTGHGDFEDRVVPAWCPKNDSAAVRIRVCFELREDLVLPNQDNVVRRADHDSLKALELAQVEAATEEVCPQGPHVEVGEGVQRLQALILAPCVTRQADVCPGLVVPEGGENDLKRVARGPDLRLERDSVRPPQNIAPVRMAILEVFLAVHVAVAAPGREAVTPACRGARARARSHGRAGTSRAGSRWSQRPHRLHHVRRECHAEMHFGAERTRPIGNNYISRQPNGLQRRKTCICLTTQTVRSSPEQEEVQN
jgi:hypothetical protein